MSEGASATEGMGCLFPFGFAFFQTDPELVGLLLCAARLLYGDYISPSESSLSALGVACTACIQLVFAVGGNGLFFFVCVFC